MSDMNSHHILSRRTFLRSGLSVAGILLSIGCMDAVDDHIARALTTPVNFVCGRKITYDKFFTNEMRVNGNIAWCVNPAYYAPPSGTYGTIYDDPTTGSAALDEGISPSDVRWQIYKLMWNGVEGPAYSDAFFPSTWYDGSAMNWDRRYVCQHILLSDLYALNADSAMYGCSTSFKNWARQNVTGVAKNPTTGEWNVIIPGSMRAHLSAEADGGDTSRFPYASDGFQVYLMDAGWDSAHKKPYQKIMFFESSGKLTIQKIPEQPSWL